MPFKVEHEWDDNDEMHRLIVKTSPNLGNSIIEGDWYTYAMPATIRHDNRLFVWFTKYWTGYFPLEKILELVEEIDCG